MKCSINALAQSDHKLNYISLPIILYESGNKNKQKLFSGFKLMSRDRLSHIHYEMHILMFPQVVTFDCKQYLQQLMFSESIM